MWAKPVAIAIGIILYLLIGVVLILATAVKPAKAALEYEELLVRCVTGLPLPKQYKGCRYARRFR